MRKKNGIKRFISAAVLIAAFAVTECFGSVPGPGVVQAAQPDGSETNPYPVSNVTQLNTALSNPTGDPNVYILLQNNLDISSTVNIQGSFYSFHIDMDGHTVNYTPGTGTAFLLNAALCLKNGTISGGNIDCNGRGLNIQGLINCAVNMGSGTITKSGYLDPTSHITVNATGLVDAPFVNPYSAAYSSILYTGNEPDAEVSAADTACFSVNNNEYRLVYMDGYNLTGTPVQPYIAALKKNAIENPTINMELKKASSNGGGSSAYQVGDTVTVAVPSIPSSATYVWLYIYNDDQPIERIEYDLHGGNSLTEVSYQIKERDLGKRIRAVLDIDAVTVTDKAYSSQSPAVTSAGGSSSSPSSSSGSSSGSSSSGSTTPATNVTATSSGESKVTDSRGKAITNSLVTIKTTDAAGNTVSKQVLTDDNGNIAKKEVVNVTQEVSLNGKTTEVEKSYLAASDGTVYDTPGFTDVSDIMGVDRSDLSDAGKVVYIKEDGSLMQGEKFNVTTKTGKKIMYAADDDCNIIRNGFFNAKKTGTTEKAVKNGATYFAKANGQIITNALFTVKTTKSGKVKVKINKKGSKYGETVTIDDPELYASLKGAGKTTKSDKYYATKSGKLAKSTWVTVGDTDYYCGSKGKIAKSKKHPINNV